MHSGAAQNPMTHAEDGAELFRSAALRALPEMEEAFAGLAPDQAGIRLQGMSSLRLILSPSGEVGSIASAVLGPKSRAVRAILFDKTAATNWSLAWHQDRTICVKRRMQVDGFGPWTIKDGMQHVAPPFELLRRMATLRVHLDDVPPSNAPLLVAPGSHRLGKIVSDKIEEAVRNCGTRMCLAEAGDVWLYATPILHASEAAKQPQHRRVLQIDFAAFDLPGGLEWLGV